MPNALAIAAVTATLKDLLNDSVTAADLNQLGAVDVSAHPPDELITDPPKNCLNIFPWKVTQNAAFSNQDLPHYSKGGTRLCNSKLALDIHYILSATGATDLSAPILLGHGMKQLHETPILTSALLNRTVMAAGSATGMVPADYRMLSLSNLSDQIESVRLTPSKSEDEELSKIWPAFNASLRLSALYQVSLVLIIAKKSLQPSLPVKTVGIRVNPLLRPQIKRVERQTGDRNSQGLAGPVTMTDRLLLHGSGLASEHVRIQIGEIKLTPVSDPQDNMTDLLTLEKISIRLPGPSAMTAGLKVIMVEHLFEPATPPERQREISNAVPVIILPDVQSITHSGTVNSGDFSGTLSLTTTHDIGFGQNVKLHLTPAAGSASGPGFSVDAQQRSTIGKTVTFELADIPSTTYLYRLEIDNAQTLLNEDASGNYVGPSILLDANP